jgi:hypothetical protein
MPWTTLQSYIFVTDCCKQKRRNKVYEINITFLVKEKTYKNKKVLKFIRVFLRLITRNLVFVSTNRFLIDAKPIQSTFFDLHVLIDHKLLH